MKTWWDYWPLLFVAYFFPFLAACLPTVQIKGRYIGGGVIRQKAINALSEQLPNDVASSMVASFMQHGTANELLLFLPIGLNAALVFCTLAFFIASLHMKLSNAIKLNKYSLERKASKGA